MTKRRHVIAGWLLSCLLLLLCLIPGTAAFADGAAKEEDLPDCSSGRLLVRTGKESLFRNRGTVLSSYDGVYLVQYETEQEAQKAYAYFQEHADAVEADVGIFAAEDMADAFGSAEEMTKTNNPFAELNKAAQETEGKACEVAMIDTGLDDAEEAVSMIGASTKDDHGHGTLVAARIRQQNPDVRILSVKALDENGHGTMSSVYAAFVYAMSQKVKIINLSMCARSTTDSAVMEEAVKEAVRKGILVVGAAGNKGEDAEGFVPGKLKDAIICGAACGDGSRRPSSNYGNTVDYYVAAPSTSEAAGTLSGWLSAHGKAALEKALNRDLIFTRAYTEQKEAAAAGSFGDSDPESGFTAAADTFHEHSVTTKEWSEIRPQVDKWIRKNIPYQSPCAGLIDWKNETASGLDCSGFVNAMVHLYYDDGNIHYDWQGSWFASETWPRGLEAQGLRVLKDKTRKGFEEAYDKGVIQDGDIVVFSNDHFRGVHVAILYGENKNGEVVLVHAYGSKLQKTTFQDVYEWDFLPASEEFRAAGSGAYSYYEVFAGTPREPEEAGIQVVKKISETFPKLVVKKELSGNGAEAGKSFSFTIRYTPKNAAKETTETFSLKGGKSQSFLCEPGSAYEVEEQSYAKDGYTTTPKSRIYKGSMPENPAPGQKFQFTISYVKPGETKKTKETFRLAGGEKKVFAAEPESAYEITESEPDGKWSCTSGLVKSGTTGAQDSVVKVVFKNRYTNEDKTLTFVNSRKVGWLSLQKQSALPEVTEQNCGYALAGAKYAVYAKADVKDAAGALALAQPNGLGVDEGMELFAAAKDGRRGTFLVTEDGSGKVLKADGSGAESDALELTAGSYFVVETAPGRNYWLNPHVEEIQVEENERASVEAEDWPVFVRAACSIEKHAADPENEERFPLEGTEFTLQYYDNEEGDISGTPQRTWKLKAIEAEDGTCRADLSVPECLLEGSDPLFSDADGSAVFPIGTLRLWESKAAPGYTREGAVLTDAETGEALELTDGAFLQVVTREHGLGSLRFLNQFSMENQPVTMRTKAVYPKTGGQTVLVTEGMKQKNASVAIRDHVMLKGLEETENHFFRLKGKLKDRNTGEILKEQTRDFIAKDGDGQEELLEFSGLPAAELSGRSLYVSEELYEVVRAETEDKEEETLIAREDEGLYPEAMTDEQKEAQRIYVPEIKTELTDGKGAHRVFPASEICLEDRVSLCGLKSGLTYRIKGVLMDGETGKPLMNDQGFPVTAESEPFTPETEETERKMTFVFPALTLGGHEAVAFEELYCLNAEGTEREDLVAEHKDLQEKGQTVVFQAPEIRTRLTTGKGGRTFTNTKGLALTDQVEMKHLSRGASYVVKGYLVKKSSGKYLKQDGSETSRKEEAYTVSTSFQAEKETHTLSMPFRLDASGLRSDLVCFEELYLKGTGKNNTDVLHPAAMHADRNDLHQTVTYHPPTGDKRRPLAGAATLFAGTAGLSAAGLSLIRKKRRGRR